MSPAGPLPEQPRRRTWLWILLGLVAAVLIACCLLATVGGEVVTDLATWAAEQQTQQAGQ